MYKKKGILFILCFIMLCSNLTACGNKTEHQENDISSLTDEETFAESNIENNINLAHLIDGNSYVTLCPTQKGDVLITGYLNKDEAKDEKDLAYLQEVKNWKDIVAVSVSGNQVLGLKKNGTVVQTDRYSCLDISDWNNIVKIVNAGYSNTKDGRVAAGLRQDGTVVCVGLEAESYQYESGSDGEQILTSKKFDGSEWTDIVDIGCSYGVLLGLKKDGTVVIAGNIENGKEDVSDWRDIKKIYVSEYIVAAIDGDDNVHALGTELANEINGWQDIEEIKINGADVFGLTLDGRIISTFKDINGEYLNWENVKDFSLYNHHIAVLFHDGTVKTSDIGVKSDGYFDTSEWTDIIQVFAETNSVIGLRSDRSLLVAFGDEENHYFDDITNWEPFD